MAGKYRECPVCGKRFLVPVGNLYKLLVDRKVAHFCSYNCYREVQKQKEGEKDTRDHLGIQRKV